MSDAVIKTLFGDIKIKTTKERPDLTNARKCFGRDGDTVCAAYQLPNGDVYIAGIIRVIDGSPAPLHKGDA